MLAVLYLSRHSPVLGSVLVAGGAPLISQIIYYDPPIWVITFAVAVIGIFGVRRFSREQNSFLWS